MAVVCLPRGAIVKGEVVVIKGGYILTREQRDKIGKKLGPSDIQITEDLFIGPTTLAEREGGMMHLNHCCEPAGPGGLRCDAGHCCRWGTDY